MRIHLERAQPDLMGIRSALSDFRNSGAVDSVPRVAGAIAVELYKLLIEEPIIEKLPVPHLISGDAHDLVFTHDLVAKIDPGDGRPVTKVPNRRSKFGTVLGPLPLLKHVKDGVWSISTEGFVGPMGWRQAIPVDEWLGQKIATIEETGHEPRDVKARDLINVVRNTQGAHLHPDNHALERLRDLFNIMACGTEGTSYPFWFCIALGMVLCGDIPRGSCLNMRFDWRPPSASGEVVPLGVSTEDLIIIKAHPSVPWVEGAPTENTVKYTLGPPQ